MDQEKHTLVTVELSEETLQRLAIIVRDAMSGAIEDAMPLIKSALNEAVPSLAFTLDDFSAACSVQLGEIVREGVVGALDQREDEEGPTPPLSN